MNKPLLGLIVGGLLGVLDGSTALLTAPELRAEIAGIVLGSSAKGLIVGLVTGLVALKLKSLARGVVAGLLVAVALTLPIAIQNANYYENQSYYWKILLPGALTGALVGYATMRYGKRKRPAEV